MGTTQKQIDIILNGQNRAKKAFGEAEGMLKALSGQALATAAGFSAAMGVSSFASMAVDGMKQVVSTFADFESAMSRVKALTNATEQQFAGLTDQAKYLGAQTVFTAQDAAEGMGFFALAFEGEANKVEKIMGAIGPTLNLAAAGQMSIAESADIVAKLMSGMGIQAQDTGYAVDVLTKAMSTANTNLVQLGHAFRYAGPMSKAAGLSLEQTTAAIQMLSNAGMQADMAGTILRGALMALTSPSAEAQKVMNQLGIATMDAAGRMRPLADIVEQFERAMASMGSGQRLEVIGRIFDNRNATGFIEFLDKGSAKLREMEAALHESAGTAARIATTQLDNLKGDWVRFTSNLEEAVLSVGYAAEPLMTPIVAALTAAVPVVREFGMEFTQVFSQMLPVAESMVAGVVAALAPLASGIVSTVEYLAPFVYSFMSTTAAFVQFVGEAFGSGMSMLGEFMGMAGSVVDAALNAMGITGTGLGNLQSMWVSGFAAMEFVIKNWQEVVELGMHAGIVAFVNLADRFEWVFTKVIPGIWDWFKRNWMEVFTGLLNYTTGVFDNLGQNISRNMKAIWDNIRSGGQKGFEFTWVPLTEGLHAAFKDLPQIAAFESSRVAKELQQSLDAKGNSFVDRLADFVDERGRSMAGFGKAFGDLFRYGGSGMPEFKVPDAGGVPGQDSRDDAGRRMVQAMADVQRGVAAVLGNNRFSGLASQFYAQLDPARATAEATRRTAEEAKKTTGLLKQVGDDLKQIAGKIGSGGVEFVEVSL